MDNALNQIRIVGRFLPALTVVSGGVSQIDAIARRSPSAESRCRALRSMARSPSIRAASPC